MIAGTVSFARLLGAIVLLSVLTACATMDQKIGLNYAPFERSFGRHDGEIAVSRAEDQVQARNTRGEWIIGAINNVHGVHQADLLADKNLGEWITEALLLELKQAGYTVTYAAALPQGVQHGVLISGIGGFMNINKGMVSSDTRHELKFNVEFYKNGAKVKAFTVASRDNNTLALAVSQEEKERIMLRSLQDALRQIIPEIISQTAQK